VDGLGGDLNIAHEVELADVVDANFLNEFVPVFDGKDFAGEADPEALGIEVGGAEIGARGEEAADRGVFREGGFAGREGIAEERELIGGVIAEVATEPVDFVGEADGVEGAARALGGTDEGRGDDAAAGGVPGLAGEIEGFGDELWGDGEADALAGFLVEDDGFVAEVAVFAEDDGVDGELDAVGGPGFGAGGGLEGAAVFVVDWGDELAVAFEEVDAGDEAVGVTGEGDRAGFPLAFGLVRGREDLVFAVDAAVLEFALEGVGVFEEDALDPFVEEEAGAVGEFVEHAGGEVIGQCRGVGIGDGECSHGKHLWDGGSDDVARGIEVVVGAAEGGDDALAAAGSGAEIDEEDLVEVVVDDFGELGGELGEVGAGELALEDGVLEVIAPGAHDFEDAAEAFVIGDVVADEVRVAHRARVD
jgi:hypothetical protein